MTERRMIWVVPCYNEQERLDAAQVEALVSPPGVGVLFVNDGSTDDTVAVLEALAGRLEGRARVLSLARNQGKAEAVRHGLMSALDDDADIVGYLDADFATPPAEANRILAQLESQGARVAMGARVRRLGADIDRRRLRHYLGRLFATVASLSLEIPVYDTQCGAKVFAAGEPLKQALVAPFRSRWAFDVELIGRLLDGGLSRSDFLEVPLREWRDVRGSKLTSRAMLSAGLDLLGLARRRRRR